MQLVNEIAVGCELGEGVLWHPIEQCLWWTDIHGCTLYRFNPRQNKITRFSVPERLTAFGFTADPERLIVSFASGIASFWPASAKRVSHATPEQGRPGQRFNDGRVDPRGRFWAGTMNELQPDTASSALYCWSTDCHRELSGLQISNGLCWSPDGATAYHADSPTRCIMAYDFSPEGRFSDPRLLVQTPEGAYPDGACTDAHGNLWSAHWGAGQVVCYSPQGDLLTCISVPTSQPTCVAFGGPDLRDLYVTSAWEGMSESQRLTEPRAGNIFVYRGSAKGRACDFYRL
ncbi:SMP-30/gluconolactonase/LRE family protein [Gilvimarinus agarilyticus]|uniref:SMP-30/gluconolactonase/LRE family protein n=1 Tax=Gilvimarinus agarilyticus TaxID=679259 RepID=UPI000B1F8554|nr:SMP-30/gluconolactonase/LRE family protein [Gilvimarinus agarilyticus]